MSHSHTESGRGNCSVCGIKTFKAFLDCKRRGVECGFELDRPITVPVAEALSDEDVPK